MQLISSKDNEFIKHVKKLKDKKLNDRTCKDKNLMLI